MTLNITLLSPKRIYQLADFRQVNAATSRPLVLPVEKATFVTRPGWHAGLCFAGVAHTGKVNVARWMVNTTDRLPDSAQFRDLVAALIGAESWLKPLPLRRRWHTFTVAGFVGPRPVGVLVSNFEHIEGRRLPKVRLTPSHVYPAEPMIVISGTGGRKVTDQQRAELVALLHEDSSHETVMKALAEVNRDVAETDDSISKACITSYLEPDGRGGGGPHFMDTILGERQDYIPDFSPVSNVLSQQDRAVDSSGRLQPIRLVQWAYASSSGTEAEHRRTIKRHPQDPDAHSNYGAFLHDRGDLVGARRAYEAALALDATHSNANGNLANLLWELDDLDGAQRHYSEALTANPRNIILRDAYARFMEFSRRRPADAEEVYRAGLAYDPMAGMLLSGLGDLCQRQHRLSEAREWYEKYYLVDPTDVAGMVALAVVRRSTGAPIEDVVTLYEKALESEPQNHVALINLAQLRFIERRDSEAITLLKRCEAASPPDEIRLEIFLYRFMHCNGPASDMEELRMLIGRGVRVPNWDYTANLSRAKEDGYSSFELLSVLTRVVVSAADAAELESYDAWRQRP